MIKFNFYFRGFDTKVLLEGKIVSRTATFGVKEKTYTTFDQVPKAEKNTAVQIQFLWVTTKYKITNY